MAPLYDQVRNENYKSFCTIEREQKVTFYIILYRIYCDYPINMINLILGSFESQQVDIFHEFLPWWRGKARRIWICVPSYGGW